MSKYSSYILYLLISFLVVILYVNDFGPLNDMQRSLDDFLCRVTTTEGTRPNIALVTIDGSAQSEFGNWPWNQDLIADLLAAVAGGEPRAIAVNFELNEDAQQDSAGYTDILNGQLTWIDNVVIPYDIALATFRSNKTSNPEHLFNNSIMVDNPVGILDESSSLLTRKLFLPADKLLQSKPYLGFVYTMPDKDRVLRRQPLVMNYEGYYYPSLSLISAAVYLGVPPDEIKVIENKEILLSNQRRIPIDGNSRYLVSFPGTNSLTRYSAAEILGDGFDFSRLKNKLVVLGLDEFISGESFDTPVRTGLSSLTFRAAVMENIINDNFLTPKNNQPLVIMLALFLIGGLCAFFLPQVGLVHRMIILAVGFIILANANYFLLSSFRIIPETIYIALELLLFMIACPFLDSSLLTGRDGDTKNEKTRLPKIEIAPRTIGPAEPVVRTIRSTEQDAENQRTVAVGAGSDKFPTDHQSIDIDDETNADATPAMGISDEGWETVGETEKSTDKTTTEQTKEPPSTPEIISPAGLVPSAPTKTAAESGKTESRQPMRQGSQEEIRNLGRYQVTGTLGKGAMGLVYKGVDPAINRPVALKTIRLDFVNDPDEEAELKERLHREAQAAGKLSHPNIVTIYDVGSEGHLQYIAMEYLEGQTLEDLIKKKTQFNYRIISQMIIQICSALEYAHNQGIVHRDIKPANIMVLKNYSVKVMDYGIARVDSSSMTKTGIAMGTPNYISPEQLKGQPVDLRADIFSLGVVMYEMLLGRRPFKGENITSLIYAITNHNPEKPSNVNPQIPLLFDHIIDRALKKEPAERYQNAREVAADLADFVESFASKS
ncbi:MAG: serine/threonine-protein kinase [bacterium]